MFQNSAHSKHSFRLKKEQGRLKWFSFVRGASSQPGGAVIHPTPLMFRSSPPALKMGRRGTGRQPTLPLVPPEVSHPRPQSGDRNHRASACLQGQPATAWQRSGAHGLAVRWCSGPGTVGRAFLSAPGMGGGGHTLEPQHQLF